MRTLLPRPPLVRWLLMAVAVAAAMPAQGFAQAGRQKQVLVLYSVRRDAQLGVIGERELPRILKNGVPEPVDYYSEFINLARFAGTDYSDAFRDFLRVKYQDQDFDLVVAIGEAAIEFVEQSRTTLFPRAAVVFFSSRASIRRPANSTGVVAPLNLADTVALALEMQPDLRQVFVVAGASPNDKVFEDAARAQFTPFASRLAFTYLSSLNPPEVEARLAALPAHSIVYFLIVERSAGGEYFHPLEYLDRIANFANAPIYSWVDSAMDRGILGGSLKDQVAQTRVIGDLAVRVLRGEPADSVPIVSPDLNVRQVDWRQLRRWRLNEANVPAGTEVRFRELSAWDLYNVYIVGTAVVLLAAAALIAGLVVQLAKRRRAEELVRASRAELATSYERIRDLGARLLHAQEAERSRIARELHDDVSQQMALLEIDLQTLSASVGGEGEVLAGEALSRTRDIGRSVHDLSHRLHPAKLRLIGLVSALRGLQRELSQSDTTITFTHENVPAALPPELTLCLFRIVQEVLQNSLKYSGAGAVSVHLRGGPDALALTVADNGAGFEVDTAWGKGLGLISMRERVDAIGGTFAIRSRPGAGTRVDVSVPLRVGYEVRADSA